MKKVTVTVQYDEEKYKAVKMYLEKKGKNLDDEINMSVILQQEKVLNCRKIQN